MLKAFEDEKSEDSKIDDLDAAPHLEKSGKGLITDKQFYKAMQKVKDRGNHAVPPKKSASAYIIFGKEVN